MEETPIAPEEPILVEVPEETPIDPGIPVLVEVPEESPIAPEVQVQTTSTFFKIARAVGGDSLFRIRVEMALEINDLPKVRANLIHIAKKVSDNILCTVEGTVDTSNVTDEQIIEAIETVPVSEH